MVMPMGMPVGVPGFLDDEARALQDMVAVALQAASDMGRRRHGGDAVEHAGFELREGVEHGRDEHVAGDPAHRVQMDVHVALPPAASDDRARTIDIGHDAYDAAARATPASSRSRQALFSEVGRYQREDDRIVHPAVQRHTATQDALHLCPGARGGALAWQVVDGSDDLDTL
jgi:hypothetical protein